MVAPILKVLLRNFGSNESEASVSAVCLRDSDFGGKEDSFGTLIVFVPSSLCLYPGFV